MGKSLQEMIEALPVEQQNAVEARFQVLYAEALSLRDLRKAQQLTQEHLAKQLNIRQESVSRIEKRTDLLLSTLNSYVKAMGGELKLVVAFPGRPPVTLEGLLQSNTLSEEI